MTLPTLGAVIDYTVNGLILGNIDALIAVGLALIFGVYRFLSIALATCNVIGNAVAAVVVATRVLRKRIETRSPARGED